MDSLLRNSSSDDTDPGLVESSRGMNQLLFIILRVLFR